MIHARIQELSSGGGGGGGVQVHLVYEKKLRQRFVFKLFFYTPTYFTEVQWLLSKKTIICQGSSGGGFFSRGGGGPTFYREVQLLFPQ